MRFQKGDPGDNLVGGVCVGGKGSKAQYAVILIFEFNKFEFSRSGVRTHPPVPPTRPFPSGFEHVERLLFYSRPSIWKITFYNKLKIQKICYYSIYAMILSKLKSSCVLSIYVYIKIFVWTLINKCGRKKLTTWHFLMN